MLLWILAACLSTRTAPAEPPISFSEIAAEYKTAYQLAVSAEAPPGVWMLCKMPSPGVDYPFHGSEDGIEADTRITVYANDTAWPAMLRTGARRFPVGSVIVKQKRGGDLGVMRKRAEGWEYAYVSEDGAVSSDPEALSACASCHEHGTVPASAKGRGVVLDDPRDAVFLSATR